MVLGLESFSYQERLGKLGSFSMKQRRLRGGPIGVYKIIRDIGRVDRNKPFPLVQGSITRRQRVTVRSKRFRGDLRKDVFTQRVVGLWISLPQRVVKAGTLTTFKKSLFR